MRSTATKDSVAELERYGLGEKEAAAIDSMGILYIPELRRRILEVFARKHFGPVRKANVKTALANYMAGREVKSKFQCTYDMEDEA